MKLVINQNSNIQEMEIIINCSSLDVSTLNLARFIQQYSSSLEGMIDGNTYYVPLNSILYVDCVDRNTFFYDSKRTYACQFTLTELENKLKNALFMRISKNCIANIAYIARTCPFENHRMKLVMRNGETLIATRNYKETLKEALREFNSDLFYSLSLPEQGEVFRHYPERSVYNVGKVIGFSKIPERIVALSYAEAELLAALGLTERIAAIAPAESTILQVLEPYRKMLEPIPTVTCQNRAVLNQPEIMALKPDLVIGTFYAFHMLKNDTEVRYEDSKINLYVLESTVPQRATLESLYKDILNLGKIFGVEDRAVKLAEDMQNRITILTRGLVLQKHVHVFVYDGCENLPSTASGGTFENSLITAAGGENVFDGEKEPYIRVTWEQIAERNPDVILVHDFADHISAREKIQILKERRELETVSAVKNNRFLIVSLQEVFPGIQNVNVIEKFIRFFYPYAL